MLITLAEALAARPDHEPERGQDVVVDGKVERLHRALERTAVIGPELLVTGHERRLVRLRDVLVDPDVIAWRDRDPFAWNQDNVSARRGRWAAARSARTRRARGSQSG